MMGKMGKAIEEGVVVVVLAEVIWKENEGERSPCKRGEAWA